MGSSVTKETDSSSEYYQLVADSTMHANTWDELVARLKKHIESGALDKEWEKLGAKEAERNAADDLFSTARLQCNTEKNRYVNILPYDSTRVKLLQTEVKGSDYINANFISTRADKTVIACQAPMENTVSDFHRMLWETSSGIIVMLTKFVEGGKLKANEYFPPLNEPAKTYGEFSIQTIEETPVQDFYVIRKFSLTKNGEKRAITQFHFLAWPDHGVPDESAPLLEMMLSVNKLHEESSSKSPIVVHCSAGIGRTGTYVIVSTIVELINASIKQDIKTPPTLNLMKSLHQIRGMRSGMVTHKDQYEFCYKMVLTYIQKIVEDYKLSNLPEGHPNRLSLPLKE